MSASAYSSPPERRPLRTDSVLAIDTPGAPPVPPPWVRVPAAGAASGAAGPPPPEAGGPAGMTRVLDTIWSSDGGGQGGRPLDEALSNLGQVYVEGSQVVWQPPADLDPIYQDYLAESLAQLNRLIEAGVMVIEGDGTLRPVTTEVPTTPTEA
jgi:hypothetical protein